MNCCIADCSPTYNAFSASISICSGKTVNGLGCLILQDGEDCNRKKVQCSMLFKLWFGFKRTVCFIFRNKSTHFLRNLSLLYWYWITTMLNRTFHLISALYLSRVQGQKRLAKKNILHQSRLYFPLSLNLRPVVWKTRSSYSVLGWCAWGWNWLYLWAGTFTQIRNIMYTTRET